MDIQKVLITSGLGDFIASEAFFTDFERTCVTEVYFASRARYAIETLIDTSPIFPNLRKKVTLWDTWSETEADGVFAIDHKSDLLEKNAAFSWGLNEELIRDLTDINMRVLFSSILGGHRTFNRCTLLEANLADVSRFSIPTNYGIINPYSPSNRHDGLRDFTQAEWASVLRFLEKLNQPAIVINRSNDFIPKHDLLVNLNNKTTIPEAVELCKRAGFYIGIDSWMSVLMSKFLTPHTMIVKSMNQFVRDHISVYFAPHKTFPNLFNNLDELI